MQAIKVINISKSFGSNKAIENLNFSIDKGEIFGFLGPSGSGKTTTINVLTGQIIPDEGTSFVEGVSSKKITDVELSKIGLVTEESGFYENMSLYNNIRFFSKFFGVKDKNIDDILKRVGLYDDRKLAVSKLSTGMKQRMLFARALINKPDILFLDEPTSGLDPTTSVIIHDMILELKRKGVTIFLTTHDMNEATLLCDDLVLIKDGKIIEKGSPSQLIKKYNKNKKLKIRYIDDKEEIISFLNFKNIKNLELNVESIHSCEPTLEDIFIELTGGKLSD